MLLTAPITGLPKDSAAYSTQIVALDLALIGERTGRLSSVKHDLLPGGIGTVLGREDRRPPAGADAEAGFGRSA